MTHELVSVIVPIYKVELYLDKCIQSIVSQTYRNLEIILIDDGSPDRCGEICDEWAKKDSRIRVFHQQNSGVTRARAKGVELAKGSWIFFVDSDDILPNTSIENLISKANECDIIIGQVEFTGPYKWPYKKLNILLQSNKYISKLLTKKIHGGPNSRLIRKDLFNFFIFDIPPKIICGEDFLMNLRLGRNAKNIRVISDIVYKYIYRENSAMSNNPFNSIQYSLLFEKHVWNSLYGCKKSLISPLLQHYIYRCIVFFKNIIKGIIKI